MLRRAPLRSDPEKVRDWQDRSRKPIPRTVPLRDTPLLPRSKDTKRAAARHAEEFGPQAELCRHLPCCACFPALYGEGLDALLYRTDRRQSDPHHCKTRPGGKDEHTVPLCMGPAGHHRACSGINSSQRKVEQDAGIVFAEVAARLHAHVSGRED